MNVRVLGHPVYHSIGGDGNLAFFFFSNTDTHRGRWNGGSLHPPQRRLADAINAVALATLYHQHVAAQAPSSTSTHVDPCNSATQLLGGTGGVHWSHDATGLEDTPDQPLQ